MPPRAREQISRAEAYRWYAQVLREIAGGLRPSKCRTKLKGVADSFDQMSAASERSARSKEAAKKNP
jgi:hypothetical protein